MYLYTFKKFGQRHYQTNYHNWCNSFEFERTVIPYLNKLDEAIYSH